MTCQFIRSLPVCFHFLPLPLRSLIGCCLLFYRHLQGRFSIAFLFSELQTMVLKGQFCLTETFLGRFALAVWGSGIRPIGRDDQACTEFWTKIQDRFCLSWRLWRLGWRTQLYPYQLRCGPYVFARKTNRQNNPRLQWKKAKESHIWPGE